MVAFVPAIRKLLHGLGLLAVQTLKEIMVYHLAVVSGAAFVDPDRPANLRFMCGHDVHQVPQGLGVVVPAVQALEADVNMHPAASGRAALHPGVAELPEEFLEGFHVGVGQDRGDQFALFVVRSSDAHVPLEFPFPALCVPGAPGHVAVPAGRVFVAAGAEVLGGNPGCVLAGDVVSLDLYSEGLGFQVLDLAGGFLCHGVYLLSALPCVFSLSVCTYITLKGINSKLIRR